MRIEAEVVVDPAIHSLRARYRVTDHPAESWWLHDGLQVLSCRVDGVPVVVRRLMNQQPSPFTPRAHLVEAVPGAVLELDVAGGIDQVEADVNAIGPDLVELAAYAAWYPVFQSLPRFDYVLQLQLRGHESVAANARLADSSAGWTLWHSAAPVLDMTVVSAPSLVEWSRPGSPVRLLADESTATDRLLDLTDRALQYCAGWWGPLSGQFETITVVLSPRAGWSYSRLPVILLSGRSPLDYAALHTLLHEIGHLWWSVADPATPDDWLNEGLAEYTADRLDRELLSAPERDTHLAAAVAELEAHPSDPAVLRTSMADPDGLRHRNRYLRPSLALLELEELVGKDSLDEVLARWLEAGRTTALATGLALQLAADLLSAEAIRRLNRALVTPGWRPDRPSAVRGGGAR